nr:hypothetical protein [uncultured Prevotella sp.]
MTFIFNYKGKNYTEEEIAQRISAGIFTQSDKNTRLLIMNLSNTQLRILKSLLPDIQEICDCLFLQKYMAAITLTNLLFETMVKLTLVYHEANGRTMDDGYDFGNIYETELNKYGEKNLGENIAILYKKKIITSEERDRLCYLKNSFRNPYSHGSNNKYVESAKTKLYEGHLGSNEIKECIATVKGNPYLLLDARRTFIRQYGLGYFAEIVNYITTFDKELQKLYHK